MDKTFPYHLQVRNKAVKTTALHTLRIIHSIFHNKLSINRNVIWAEVDLLPNEEKVKNTYVY